MKRELMRNNQIRDAVDTYIGLHGKVLKPLFYCNPHPDHNNLIRGHLMEIKYAGGRIAFVVVDTQTNEMYHDTTILSRNIQTADQAIEFVRSVNDAYERGKVDGRNDLRRDFSELMKTE